MTNANLGKDWERELATTHDYYRSRGLADVVQNPNEWAYITYHTYLKRCGKYPDAMFAKTLDGRWLMMQRSDVDFSGGGDGFSICFDAKTTKEKTFALSNIKDHQIHRLLLSSRSGCISGFMVRMESVGRAFFVPTRYIDERWIKLKRQVGRAKPGTASLSIADLEANAIEVPRTINGLWDWLAVLR